MKKISVYTRSGSTSPSGYYRIFQFEKDIECEFKNNVVVPDKIYSLYNKSIGIKRKYYQLLFYVCAYFNVIKYLVSDIINKPDVIFVSRAIMPRIAPFPIILLMEKAFNNAGKVIWDIDDDIIEVGEITKAETELLYKYASNFIVVGDFFKKYIPKEKHSKISILATTDGDFVKEDIKVANAIRKDRYENGEIGLLWLATYTSLPFVEDIVPFLDEAARIINEKYNKEVILEIVCNRGLNVDTKYLKIDNITWTKEVARDRIINANIGIYPLRYTEQTLGKSGFKLIQYMSVALPTISSAVGQSTIIVNNGKNGILVSYENLSEWTDGLTDLASSWDGLEKMGANAKETWETEYSYIKNMEALKEIFCGE